MTLTDSPADLWTEASIDYDAEAQQRRVAACRAAALPVWPVLAAATTVQDYVNRKAVVADRLDKAVAAVVQDPALFAVARAELEATYDADYEVLARARAREAHAKLAAERRQRLFEVTQAKVAKTATSQRYETAKKVVEGGIYADVQPGDNRSSGGEVRLEGAILDAGTANLIVQAYEALSPENQAKFDSIPLDKLTSFLWSKAKFSTVEAAGLENLGDERAPEFGKDKDDDDDDRGVAGRHHYMRESAFNLEGFQAGMTSAKWGMTAEAAKVPEDIEASSPGFGRSYLAGIQAFLRQGGFRKGAPFADYEDFDACVKANSDKDDPEAYCGKIKHETEDKKEGARDPGTQKLQDDAIDRNRRLQNERVEREEDEERKRREKESAKTASDWGEGVIGKQLLGMPGSQITAVEPTADYLTNGPVGDGWMEGSRAVTTDFIVSVKHADGRVLKLPKSYQWLQEQKGGTGTVTSSIKPHVNDGFIRTEGDRVQAYIDGAPLGWAPDEPAAERALATHMATTGAWKPVWAVTGTKAEDFEFDQRIVSSAHYAAMQHTAIGWSPASGMGPRGKNHDWKHTHTFHPIGWDQMDARPHPGSQRIKPGSKVMLHGKMDPSGHLLHIEDEHGNHQTVDKRSLKRHGSKTAADNPFAKKDDDDKPKADKPDDSGGDDGGDDDAKPDEPAQGGDLDPTAMQPGQQVTLNYTLTGANPGNGSCDATFDSTDGTSYYFTYSKGRFAVTQQGDKWVDSVGTEFTFEAGADPNAQDPTQAIDTATQAPPQPPQPTAAKTASEDDERGMFRRFLAWLGKEANPYTDQNPYQSGPSMQDAAPSAPNAAPQPADQAAPNPAPTGGDAASTRPRQMPAGPTPSPAPPTAPMQPQVGTPGGPGTDQYQMTNQPRDLFTGSLQPPDPAWWQELTPRMKAAYLRDQADRLDAEEG